jgi:hypothetical protein
MDATRKIGTSYCHALCLSFYIAFFRIHSYQNIYAITHPFSTSFNFIGRVYYSLLPTRKRRAKMVFDFQSNQSTALIPRRGINNGAIFFTNLAQPLLFLKGITGMNPKASFGNIFRNKLRGIITLRFAG